MKKCFPILVLFIVLFSGCKSNQDLYNAAYQRLKTKEEALKESKPVASNSPSADTTKKAVGNSFSSEKFTVLLGDSSKVSTYNIVVKNVVNKTNAKGYYTLFLEKGFPAVLVQNEKQLFRILVASFKTKEEAEKKVSELIKEYAEAYILVKL